jgi:2-hydroxychromene-2-carboxylate isomerase
VLIAAAACEMHPAAVQVAAKRPALARQLEARTAQAAELGVREVPAICVGERTFHGERAIEQAAAHMRAPVGAAAAGGR